MVFKYGPPEPRRPQFPPSWPEEMRIKYGPPEPRPQTEPQPELRPKDSEDKETKAILKQIADCLKKIKKLLSRKEAKPITAELGICIAELNLLYQKLNDLRRGQSGNETVVFKPGRRGRDIVIMYIVVTAARPPEKNK